ncbi:MAG: deoxyguanosinetriphosphate triphosphohydrolase [Gammaproteobacteria bacterium]|nr:deoxyguanosinetriphosphate triphosphohydrolase [Gammaproteobacteria bacterium]
MQVYAVTDQTSRGRSWPEPPDEFRGEFQRDRDRVIHSAAFRRLEYKTQVFVNHEGDMFRTRLTHSIEVAQISRTVARALEVNEDLTEAIALAHDLGHTPFGHAGQDALHACMRRYGGFEHNLQSLRVVDVLEEKYASFTGLNLSFETREGILKHCSKTHARELGEVAARFINGGQPSIEAQIANLADEIAYNNHDVDDALRAELITMEDLSSVPGFVECRGEVEELWPGLPRRRAIHEVIRRMINAQVTDVLNTTRRAIEDKAPASVDAVRKLEKPLVKFSEPMRGRHVALKRFLREHVYRHYRVRRMSGKAARVVQELFRSFMSDPALLPEEARERVAALEADNGRAGRARSVADYIAGMTDRFAIAEHQRIFDPARLT